VADRPPCVFLIQDLLACYNSLVVDEEILSAILAGRLADLAGQGDLPAGRWFDIAKLAGRLGVAPLLYRQLIQRAGAANLPAEVAADLRGAYYQCHATNAHLFHQLSSVLADFEAAGIPVILLKGAYLADAIYRDAGLRPMGDLDILVSREDVLRGVEVLQMAGFAPYQDFAPEVEFSLAKHMPPFQKSGVIIELHWNIVAPESPVKVDVSGLWARAERFETEQVRGLALCREDLLLHLCIHTAQHHFNEQMRTLCDIREVTALHRGSLDWDGILTRAIDWHAARGVYLALRLAADLLDAPVPAEMLKHLQPADYSDEVLDWARARIFQETPPLSDNFIALMQGSKQKGRWRAFWEAMLPAPETMSRLYGVPQGLWRVYLKYPIHWWDRIRRYGGRAEMLLRGDPRLSGEAAAQQRLAEWLDR